MAKMKSKVTSRSTTARDVALGIKIRAHRLIIGMSQEKLGERLGVSFQQIQKYEKGVNRVSVARLTVIAQVLGVSAAEFFLDGEVPGTLAGSGDLSPLAKRALKALSRIRDNAVRRKAVQYIERLADLES